MKNKDESEPVDIELENQKADNLPDSNISFEDIDDKVVSEFQDIPKMKKDVIEKLEKKQVEKETLKEMGELVPEKLPKMEESIPKELPKLIFRFGSKALSCDRFQIDDEESKMLAKHLSVIIGAQNSRIYSIIIVFVVVISKVLECKDAIMLKFGKKKDETKPVTTSVSVSPEGKL